MILIEQIRVINLDKYIICLFGPVVENRISHRHHNTGLVRTL